MSPVRLARVSRIIAAVVVVATCWVASSGTADAAHSINVTARYAATEIVDLRDLLCGGFAVTANGSAGGAPISPSADDQTGTWRDHETVCTLTIPGEWDINGSATIGAANGDEIFVDYAVTAALVPNITTIYPAGTFTVAGGTGSYIDAAGGVDRRGWETGRRGGRSRCATRSRALVCHDRLRSGR